MRVAGGIADALEASGRFAAVYAGPVPGPESMSAAVIPVGGVAGTACRDELRYVVTVVASVDDLAESAAWLYGAPAAVRAALAVDPSCGGTCTGVKVASWDRIYVASAGAADVLALDVALTGTYERRV